MKYILIVILTIQASLALSQRIYKESKILTESYSYSQGEKIQINGERTFITIENSDNNMVEASIEVISRYSDKAQAKADLEKMNIQFRKKGKTIYYSNALLIDGPKSKPKSNLKTILLLKVPSYAEVEVVNSYGELTVSGDIAEINIESKFCTTNVTEYSGDLDIISKYGTLNFSNSLANIKAEGNRSDLILNNIGGRIGADMKYGTIDITYSMETESIDIKSENAPITLILPEKLSNALTVQCDNCSVNTDSCNNTLDKRQNGDRKIVDINATRSDKSSSVIMSKKGEIKIITTTTITNSK